MGCKVSRPSKESSEEPTKSRFRRCFEALFSRGSNPFAVRRPFSTGTAFLASKDPTPLGGRSTMTAAALIL
uniref:Uncharacterized protein n=1 Tax=Steinernema glaseri TaxID=37863 RepID=A0A1I7Z266_9BILA